MEYDDHINGWRIDHSRAKDIVIETKKINFYNEYTEKEELYRLEELSFFPPRFILNVTNVEHRRTTDLCTKFIVTLYNNPKKRKILIQKTIILHLSVPVSRSASTNDSASISTDSYTLPTIGDHPCGINENKPEYIKLIKYSDVVAPHWEEVAIYLHIPNEKIPVINLDHPYARMRCNKMFDMWLERIELACWCHFIWALYNVGLVAVAGKVKNIHLHESLNVASTEDSSKIINNKIDLDDLLRYLNDIPNNSDLMYFVTRLLPKETAIKVIQDIRCSGGSKKQNVRKTCEAFLEEQNPSWTKVHRALKETDCDDLADYIEAIFLPEK